MSRDKPLIYLIAPKFGGTNNVWLYRQATRMRHVQLNVICGRRENEDEFPAINAIRVDVFPKSWQIDPRHTSKWIRGVFFAINSLRNAGHGWFRYHPHVRQMFLENIQRERPDVLLFHYGTMAVRFAPLIERAQTPFAIHFNGYDLSEMLASRSYTNQLKPLVKKASALIVVAEYMKDWLLDNGATQSQIHFIPYGVPTESFTPSVHTIDSQCKFLSVGRLTKKKAPLLSLKAFAQCLQACPNATYAIIGDGPLRADCEHFIGERGLSNSVQMMGSQPSDAVRQAMSNASVFVQHSIESQAGDREGWPVAVAEAAASGLPIVATRHASIPLQVIDNETGYLVDEGDWQSMAERMTALAQDTDKRQKFGAAARQHISRWDCQIQIDQLEDVLIHAANSRCPHQ